MSELIVDVRDLTVELGERPVLHGIDFQVSRGEVVTLLGANGSGKSTLVRAIVGLIPPVTGDITIFGQPLRSFHDWPRLGYVPQRTTAAGGVPATVREVVASGRLARRKPFWPSTRSDREAVDRAIEMVGLADRADDGIHTLSGGQQQRALIARAASGDPDLLVLDEPNAGVDQRSQEAFARSLRTFVASGRTVLLVLHDMGPLEPLVSRGVVLDAGRVAYDGPVPVPVAAGRHVGHPGAHSAAVAGGSAADGTIGVPSAVPNDHPHSSDEETGPFGWTS
ncbi:metal ABC transporter ATP-binding protein [Phytoactinopolyspora mesophila]|uniref:ATP-binding cassette domain-containing protein n=1 Tax=Phytoactinopolyspora mesophila TaxID=2650750 RepID=A0A7K3M160_9ACTN|nr:ABC transporter ATP-binding protein [Phytoactinopolyspora mesophila]NDL56777.1 ATP-binding cassette domain-containing protein [Phytoactinopolyspora mesophila]